MRARRVVSFVAHRVWLLAVLVCALGLAHPAHSQGQSETWWIQGNNNVICESFDAITESKCFLSTYNLVPTMLQPRDFPSCGVPGAPIQYCIMEWAADGGEGGTFELIAEAAQYWLVGRTLPQCEVCSANSVAHPINPAEGNVFTYETDVEFAGSGAVAFRRFYNSADATGIDGVPGWRHSYGRSVNAVYQPAGNSYFGQNSLTSALYGSPEVACTSGFADIKASVSAWAGATATYTNGACVLSSGTGTIGTLQVQSSASPAPDGTPPPHNDAR
jgi:hypothetical protein